MALKFTVTRGEKEIIKKITYFKWYMAVGDNAGDPVAFAYEPPKKKGTKRNGLTFDYEIIDYGKKYDPADYRTEHGHWADFIKPTALCETRGYFNAVNTWDRGIFSFGFVQMVAKDADAQFIRLFRALLETSKAADYFPDLSLREVKGKKYIHLKTAEGKYVQLETRTDARRLQKYLNPTPAIVEPAEAECAARFAHWATNEKEHRDMQVRSIIEELKRKFKSAYSDAFPIDGRADYVCLVLFDIRHQNRGGPDTVKAIFRKIGTDDKELYKALIQVGKVKYKHRVALLDSEIQKMIEDGTLGKKKYSKAQNDFV